MNKQMVDGKESISIHDCITDSKSAGRWTQEEHRLFLQGLQLYNKQWKLIADMVKTRTVVQVRTHAQKYFLKMEKGTGVLVGKFSEFQEYNGSRSNSISSFSSIDSAGNTTVDGETDSEREIILNEICIQPKTSKDQKQVNPDFLNKLNNKTSKSTDSKKRGRCKKLDDLSSAQPRKRMPASIKLECLKFEDSDHHFYDLFNFEHYGEEDLDASIVNLLDRIEWDEVHNNDGQHSRCNSPFTKSASYFSSSVHQLDNCLMTEGTKDLHEALDSNISLRNALNDRNLHQATFNNVMQELKLVTENDAWQTQLLQHHRSEKKLLTSIHSVASMTASHSANEIYTTMSAVGTSHGMFGGDERKNVTDTTGSYIPLLYADFDTWSSAVSSSVTA